MIILIFEQIVLLSNRFFEYSVGRVNIYKLYLQ